MSITPIDIQHMNDALELAARARGRTSPNPMVGALVVREGEIVGRGFHAKAGEAHAEVNALREAGDRSRGATLYCTLEPCCHHGRTPPCSQAVIGAGIKRAVIAMQDPNPKVAGKGIAELCLAGMQVEVGCMEREARRLNEHFIVYHTLGRPFVTIKWAMTLDGRTSTDSGDSKWISGVFSRRLVHHHRYLHDAVLVGAETIRRDDPILNVRLELYDGPQPKRIVLDPKLSISPDAKLLTEKGGGEVIIVTSGSAPLEKRARIEQLGGRVVEVAADPDGNIELKALMSFLHTEKLLSIFAEGGRRIHTSLLRGGYCDKIVAFIAPKLIGGSGAHNPLLDLGIGTMDQSIQILNSHWTPIGNDIYLEGYLREI